MTEEIPGTSLTIPRDAAILGATASKSINNVGEFFLAKLNARLIAVVVLPGDPFIPQTFISPGICVNSSSPELNLSISVMFDNC